MKTIKITDTIVLLDNDGTKLSIEFINNSMFITGFYSLDDETFFKSNLTFIDTHLKELGIDYINSLDGQYIFENVKPTINKLLERGLPSVTG